MIFMPFPRFVGPISDRDITNVASMKVFFIQRAVVTAR